MQEKEKLEKLEQENAALRSALQAVRQGRSQGGGSVFSWLKRASTAAILGRNLKKSINRLYSELPRNVQQETMAEVTANLIHRLTRIGSFALIVGLVPLLILLTQTWILDNQNEKLDHQNDLIGSQNLLLDQQINLEEGNRRSSYVFLMSNIMDKIDEELKNRQNSHRELSEELIGRIVALSQAFRPYRYLEDNKLIPRPLSPERGQLLYALVNSTLDHETYDHIFAKANFSYSDLPQANFAGAYLKGVNLSFANLNHGTFRDAVMDGANLSQSNLNYSLFDNTLMNGANFQEAQLRYTQWFDVLARNIKLTRADVQSGIFNGDFSDAVLEGILLHDATLNYVVLDKAYFYNQDWLQKMAGYELKGSFSIVENYTVEQGYISDSYENVIDTIFKLIPRLDSPQKQASQCESRALKLIRSAPVLQALFQDRLQVGDRLSYEAQSSPFSTGEDVIPDSLFTFLLRSQDTTRFDTKVWIRFDPRDGELWTISPTIGDATTQDYNEEMYQIFLKDCQ